MIHYRRNPSAIIKAAPRPVRRALVDRIADIIREKGFGGVEALTQETFDRAGFNARVMERYGPAAIEQARRLSVRRVGA